MRIYLNRDWNFTETFTEELTHHIGDGPQFQQVNIPHTCKETPFHYFDESEYQMVCGYQKRLVIPEEYRDKKLLLTFDGVGHECEVYVNGIKVGSHHSGYTAFTFDISNQVQYGEDNLITVKVDSRESLNIPPFGNVIDYMTYGGIYRDVYMDVKESCYMEDVFLHSDLKMLTAEVTLNCEEQGLRAKAYIYKRESDACYVLGERKLDEKKTVCTFKIPKVKLWKLERPTLYDIKIELFKGNKKLDEQIIPFGFRKAEFKKDGFYLNGKKVKIRGLNRHQSYPYVGYAMPESMQKLDADILKKELGLNAVRTSHYPQSQHFIDRCDEIGLLVFTEMPGWQHIGNYSWKKQACENVKEMVMQYRNHPSIILWGVRINESEDDDAFYKRTNAIAHKLDPTRQTGGVRANKKSHLFEDVYTYNDFSHDGVHPGCEPKGNVTSDKEKPYMVTEYNGHMFPTKTYDSEDHRMQHAIRHATVLDAIAEKEDIAGSFGWCMADYNTHQDFGSGDRICYHGVLDMFRNPKMAAAVYASQQEKFPVLETSSGMEIGEYPASTLGTSYIFTNADKVRMYKNDKFIKEYTKEDSAFKNMQHGPIAIDDLVGDLLIEEQGFTKEQSDATKYILNSIAKMGLTNIPKAALLQAGKLIVKYHMTVPQVTELYKRYIGNWGESATQYRFDAIVGDEVVKTITKAPMKQSVLKVKADHTELVEKHTYDVALVQIRMVSEHENVLAFSHEPIHLETEGPIEIIGPKYIALQGGMSGTYVKTTGKSGLAKLFVRDTQGHEEVISFMVKQGEN